MKGNLDELHNVSVHRNVAFFLQDSGHLCVDVFNERHQHKGDMYEGIVGVEPRWIFRFPYLGLWATQPPGLDGISPESARLEENKSDSGSNMCIQNTRHKEAEDRVVTCELTPFFICPQKWIRYLLL